MSTKDRHNVHYGEPEKQAPQYRKLQRGIKGVLAEWESDETSQRTYKRHRYRAQKGRWRGGLPPYGLWPDGTGWFEPDPQSYPFLLWILERRAENKGHHTIAKLLNVGIDMGQGPIVPPTPSVIAYHRKPYLEQQDPETGDIIQLPRRLPTMTWQKQTVVNICRQAVDGVYAGILNWGRRHNRFLEDADGNLKSPISVDTGRPLVPLDLIERVQLVERTPTDSLQRMSDFNSFLLSLRCGLCGEAMHGYTSTKIKPSGRTYKYRKYRCAGRVNNPGACRMPILSADALEQVVIKAVFADVVQRDGERLHDEINVAIERHRAALDTLSAKARSVLAVLTDPNLDPTRWREPAAFAAFRRALTLLLKKAVVSEASTRLTFCVHLSVTTDPIAEPDSASVVNLASTRARGSRTHRRSSSPRPLVLKTRTATGPHPLSSSIVCELSRAVKDRGSR